MGRHTWMEGRWWYRYNGRDGNCDWCSLNLAATNKSTTRECKIDICWLHRIFIEITWHLVYYVYAVYVHEYHQAKKKKSRLDQIYYTGTLDRYISELCAYTQRDLSLFSRNGILPHVERRSHTHACGWFSIGRPSGLKGAIYWSR